MIVVVAINKDSIITIVDRIMIDRITIDQIMIVQDQIVQEGKQEIQVVADR